MKKIKLFKPYVNRFAVANVIKVLLSGQLAEGPQVKAFEKEFGEMFGFSDVISLNSGTSALELAYELAGISAGDEVITPVLTAVMTNIPLARLKANIIFADAEEDLNIDVEDVKRKITPRTKAIVFVHYNGNNRGFDEIMKICAEKKITLIEDAAQAIGSDNWGKGDLYRQYSENIKPNFSKLLSQYHVGYVVEEKTNPQFVFPKGILQKTIYQDSNFTVYAL